MEQALEIRCHNVDTFDFDAFLNGLLVRKAIPMDHLKAVFQFHTVQDQAKELANLMSTHEATYAKQYAAILATLRELGKDDLVTQMSPVTVPEMPAADKHNTFSYKLSQETVGTVCYNSATQKAVLLLRN